MTVRGKSINLFLMEVDRLHLVGQSIRENLDDILYRITIEREYNTYSEGFIEHQRFTISKRITAIPL